MNFKKCYPLTDRTKSRDAVASKKHNLNQLCFLTLVWFVSTKIVVLVRPTPEGMGGAKTASRNVLEAVSNSSLSVTPVSTNCRTPSDTVEPILYRGESTACT